MKKELNAAYYDAVIRHDRKHAARWVEVARSGSVVILERKKDNDKSKIANDNATTTDRVEVSDMRKSKRADGDDVQSRTATSGGADSVNGDRPKRRGRKPKIKSEVRA